MLNTLDCSLKMKIRCSDAKTGSSKEPRVQLPMHSYIMYRISDHFQETGLLYQFPHVGLVVKILWPRGLEMQ